MWPMRSRMAWKLGVGAKRRVRSPNSPAVRTSASRSGVSSGGVVGEEEVFAGMDFAAGADEGGPDVFVGVLVGELLGEEDFDAAGGVGRVVLGVEAGAGGVEARGEDAGVVEDEEIAVLSGATGDR